MNIDNNRVSFTDYEMELLKESNVIGYTVINSNRIVYIIECVYTDYEKTSYIRYKIGGITEAHRTYKSRMYDNLDNTIVLIDKNRVDLDSVKMFD